MIPLTFFICVIVGVAIHLLLTSSYREDASRFQKYWKGQIKTNQLLEQENQQLKQELDQYVVGSSSVADVE